MSKKDGSEKPVYSPPLQWATSNQIHNSQISLLFGVPDKNPRRSTRGDRMVLYAAAIGGDRGRMVAQE